MARLGRGILMLAVWLGASAAASAQGEDAATQAASSQLGAQDGTREEEPARAEAAGEETRDRHAAAPELAKRLGLPLPLAVRLAPLLALKEAWCDRYVLRLGEDEDARTAAIQGVESKIIALLRQAPENAALADEIHGFYKNCDGETGGTEVLDLIAKARDPSTLAIRLAGVDPSARRWDRSDLHTRSTDFLLAALSVRPDTAGLWVFAAAAALRPEWQVALYEQAIRCLLPPGGAPSPKRTAAAAAVAQSLLSVAIDAGLGARAMAELRGLPPAVRSLVESGRRGTVNLEVGGVFFKPELSDLRLELAMAAVLAGDLAAARSLLARFDASRAPPRNRGASLRGEALERRLLDSWLQLSAEDPFDLLTTAVSLARNGDLLLIGSVGWQLTLAGAAMREGYPEIAVFELPHVAEKLDVMTIDDEPAPTGRDVPPRVLHAAQGLAAEIETLRREIDSETQAARAAMRDALGPDPAAAAIARRLARPPEPPFAARPLPPGVEPRDLSQAQRAAARARLAERLRLPAGFTPVRADRQQTELAVIALSEAYDPKSNGAAGGYWVLRSGDDGKTWRRPLYTGLRANLPYTVREESALPLLAGDRLEVEVEVEPVDVDPSNIAAELARRQAQSGIYLEIPFDALERDSDGDGLTDLAEQHLLTDPGNPDTNGDGIADGNDRTPTIPHGDPAAPAARLIATLLRQTAIRDAPAAAPAPEDRGGARSPAPLPDERTVFAIGDRRWFSGLRPGCRLIVLTEEEYRQIIKQISLTFEVHLEILAIDRSGRRAFVMAGGPHTYEDRDGGWQQVN